MTFHEMVEIVTVERIVVAFRDRARDKRGMVEWSKDNAALSAELNQAMLQAERLLPVTPGKESDGQPG